MEIDAYMLVIMSRHGTSELEEASEKLTPLVLVHIKKPWPQGRLQSQQVGEPEPNQGGGIQPHTQPWFPTSLGQSLALACPLFIFRDSLLGRKDTPENFPAPVPGRGHRGGCVELPGSDLCPPSSGPKTGGSRKVGQRGRSWMGRDVLPQSAFPVLTGPHT